MCYRCILNYNCKYAIKNIAEATDDSIDNKVTGKITKLVSRIAPEINIT